jgi:Spy/CpxP family protein refolding chaperone
MNLRKLLVCAVASIAMFSTTTLLQAQEGQKGKGGRGGGMMSIERLEEAVGKLSADQKTKIEAVLAKQREAMQGMQNLSQEERQAKMREAGQKFRTEIRAILTAEQQKKFDEMPQGRGQGGGGGKKKDQ